VGRAALDEDSIRLIEQLNPGIEFDWPRILKGQGSPATEPRVPVEVRRQRPDNRRPQPQRPSAEESVATAPTVEPETLVEAPVEALGPSPQSAEPIEPRQAIEIPQEFVARTVSDEATPAHARLGADGVQRLRTRYAEILARMQERTGDPVRREELRLQTERLNPDSWVTDDAVALGLEQYESVFASLREVVGQKRRRRRRGNRQRSGEPSTASVAPDTDEPDASEPGPNDIAGDEDGDES
jgi:hypothetical protein